MVREPTGGVGFSDYQKVMWLVAGHELGGPEAVGAHDPRRSSLSETVPARGVCCSNRPSVGKVAS